MKKFLEKILIQNRRKNLKTKFLKECEKKIVDKSYRKIFVDIIIPYSVKIYFKDISWLEFLNFCRFPC